MILLNFLSQACIAGMSGRFSSVLAIKARGLDPTNFQRVNFEKPLFFNYQVPRGPHCEIGLNYEWIMLVYLMQ